MNFKKRVNGSWTDTPHYIHNTSTDTITTLPAVIHPTGTTATVGLKGNTLQSSIPSPTSLIMPQGTGERTNNSINVPALSGVRWATQYPALLNAINSLPNGTYTMSISYELVLRNDVTDSSVCGWYIAKNNRVLTDIRLRWETAQIGDVLTVVDTFTIDDNNRGAFTSLYLYGCGINQVGSTGTATVTNIMLNEGSTALPYEPFGVKIPISSANTTTPVYLGEVETTRKIRKLVLTGRESWAEGSANYYSRLYSYGRPYSNALCTHAKNASSVDNNGAYLYLQKSTFMFETLADFKTYLAQQYAAGTPVTVWYVLATEETAVVNEPLMRIGNYADTLSNITIPVTAGGDTLSVDTTVQPSEVTVNYKGWHPVTNVHEFIGNYTVGTMQTLPISELETHTISELQGGEWS